jgi:hypothetical protein
VNGRDYTDAAETVPLPRRATHEFTRRLANSSIARAGIALAQSTVGVTFPKTCGVQESKAPGKDAMGSVTKRLEGFPTTDEARKARDDGDYQQAMIAYRFWYPTVSCEGIFNGNREAAFMTTRA